MTSYLLGYLSKGLSYLRLPSFHGSITISKGLKRSVKILSDEKGVIHIYSDVEEDAYFAQGFSQALERYFQLEIIRRASEGTLSEIFPEAVVSDEISLTLGFNRAAKEDANQYPSNGFLNSFVTGINTYLETTFKFTKPVEFTLFDIQEQPKPWTMQDVYRIARWHSFRTSRPFTCEFFELLLRSVSAPKVSAKMNVKKEDVDWNKVKWYHSQLPRFDHQSCIIMTKNILAVDIHAPTSIPSLYFENHVCVKGIGLNIYGASLVGLPYFFVGRNANIAFAAIPSYAGLTSGSSEPAKCKTGYKLFVDVFDSVNENRYKVGDKWRYLTPVEEVVRVKGKRDPELLFVREIEFADENALIRRVRRRVVLPGLIRNNENQKHHLEVSIEALWMQKAKQQPLEGIRLLNKAKSAVVAAKILHENVDLFPLKVSFVEPGGTFGCINTGRIDVRRRRRDYKKRVLFMDGSKMAELEYTEKEFYPFTMSMPDEKIPAAFSVESVENSWKCRANAISEKLTALGNEVGFEDVTTALDEHRVKVPENVVQLLKHFLEPIQKQTKTVTQEHKKKKGKVETKTINNEIDRLYSDQKIRDSWISVLKNVPKSLVILAIEKILQWDGDMSTDSYQVTLATGFLRAVVERMLMRVLDKDKSGYLEWYHNRKIGNTHKYEDIVIDFENPAPKYYFSSMILKDFNWIQVVKPKFFKVLKMELFMRDSYHARQIKKEKLELNVHFEEKFSEQNQGVILLLMETLYILKKQLKISFGGVFGKPDWEKEITKFSYGDVHHLNWNCFVDDSKIKGCNFVPKRFGGGYGLLPKFVFESVSGKKKKEGEEENELMENYLSFIPRGSKDHDQHHIPVKFKGEDLYSTFRFCVNMKDEEMKGWSTILPGNSGHLMSKNYFDNHQFDNEVDLKMILYKDVVGDAPCLILNVPKKKSMSDEEYLRRSTIEMETAQKSATKILNDSVWTSFLRQSVNLKVAEKTDVKSSDTSSERSNEPKVPEEEIEIVENERIHLPEEEKFHVHEAAFTTSVVPEAEPVVGFLDSVPKENEPEVVGFLGAEPKEEHSVAYQEENLVQEHQGDDPREEVETLISNKTEESGVTNDPPVPAEDNDYESEDDYVVSEEKRSDVPLDTSPMAERQAENIVVDEEPQKEIVVTPEEENDVIIEEEEEEDSESEEGETSSEEEEVPYVEENEDGKGDDDEDVSSEEEEIPYVEENEKNHDDDEDVSSEEEEVPYVEESEKKDEEDVVSSEEEEVHYVEERENGEGISSTKEETKDTSAPIQEVEVAPEEEEDSEEEDETEEAGEREALLA